MVVSYDVERNISKPHQTQKAWVVAWVVTCFVGLADMVRAVRVDLLNVRLQKRFEEIGYGEKVNTKVRKMTRPPTSAPEDVVAKRLQAMPKKLSPKQVKLQVILQLVAEFLLLPDAGRDVDTRNTSTDVAYSSGPCGTM